MGFFAKFVAFERFFMEKEFVDLFELQSRLKEGIECLFPKRIWLKAEVSAIKARSGGHCYMELSQSDENGLVAKANAVIWSSRYRFIAPYFESVTGSPFKEGMSVLVEVQVSYSQLYGLSLVVYDVDAEYSIGQMEIGRQKTIERLRQEGLMDLQSGLELPVLPCCLAVISAEDAAGYRDFIRHIQENPYGFKVDIDLFPALMQGASCPASIVDAMDRILESGTDYDAVLILRGGGARLDLACFDDYLLASVIAQYPLPVLTAIGHDQDFHVADMVAHAYVKTPTAMADFILGIYEEEDARLSSVRTRVKLAASGRLSQAVSAIDLLRSRIRSGVAMKISQMEASLKVLEARITSADPRRMIGRGYVLAVDENGTLIRNVSGMRPGDRLSVMFEDGRLSCTVDSVAPDDGKYEK